jgi:hypothetical protein
MKGNQIFVRGCPERRQAYAKTGQTLKPGMIGEIDLATAEVAGLPTIQIYARGTNGHRPRGPLCIIVEDMLQGKAYDDNYAEGDLVSYMIPKAGDEYNLIIADVSGTGDTKSAGDALMVENATGKLLVTAGTPQSTPFALVETLGVVTADTLGHCIYSGY